MLMPGRQGGSQLSERSPGQSIRVRLSARRASERDDTKLSIVVVEHHGGLAREIPGMPRGYCVTPP